MLTALVAHPYVHLLTAVGSALIAVAFLAIRAHLHDAGEGRFRAWPLPFVMIGCAAYGRCCPVWNSRLWRLRGQAVTPQRS